MRYERSPRRYERSPRRYERSPRRYERSPRRYERSPRRYERSPRSYERSPRRYERSPRRYERSPRRYKKPTRRYEHTPRRHMSRLEKQIRFMQRTNTEIKGYRCQLELLGIVSPAPPAMQKGSYIEVNNVISQQLAYLDWCEKTINFRVAQDAQAAQNAQAPSQRSVLNYSDVQNA